VTKGVPRIFHLGLRAKGGTIEWPKIETECRGRGWGSLGEGTVSPSPPARESGEHCELIRRGSGRIPDRSKFSYYFPHSGWTLLTL